jgi:hypothetical protein
MYGVGVQSVRVQYMKWTCMTWAYATWRVRCVANMVGTSPGVDCIKHDTVFLQQLNNMLDADFRTNTSFPIIWLSKNYFYADLSLAPD